MRTWLPRWSQMLGNWFRIKKKAKKNSCHVGNGLTTPVASMPHFYYPWEFIKSSMPNVNPFHRMLWNLYTNPGANLSKTGSRKEHGRIITALRCTINEIPFESCSKMEDWKTESLSQSVRTPPIAPLCPFSYRQAFPPSTSRPTSSAPRPSTSKTQAWNLKPLRLDLWSKYLFKVSGRRTLALRKCSTNPYYPKCRSLSNWEEIQSLSSKGCYCHRALMSSLQDQAQHDSSRSQWICRKPPCRPPYFLRVFRTSICPLDNSFCRPSLISETQDNLGYWKLRCRCNHQIRGNQIFPCWHNPPRPWTFFRQREIPRSYLAL